MVFSRTPALAIATVKLISLARMPALRASLGLLVLPARPLVPPDFHPTVLTARCGHFLDPVGRTLTHQFPSLWIHAPCPLVASQCWGSGDEPRLQTAEQQFFPAGGSGGTSCPGGSSYAGAGYCKTR